MTHTYKFLAKNIDDNTTPNVILRTSDGIYIPFDENDPMLVIAFIIAFVLSFAFVARRISVSRRKHNSKLADVALFSVENDRMMLKHSPRILERPPPPLPPGLNKPT